ncbi:MAG: hypothetical protein ACI4PD_08685 [Butyricicoccus sp.]
MPTFTMIDGVSRELTGWPVMIGGVSRELDSMFGAIDGTQREIFSAKTRWDRYTAVSVYVLGDPIREDAGWFSYRRTLYSGYTITSMGKINVTGSTSEDPPGWANPSSSSTTIDYYYALTIDENDDESPYYYQYRTYSRTAVKEYQKGTYVDTVESADPSAYPENGKHTDGYWYVKIS